MKVIFRSKNKRRKNNSIYFEERSLGGGVVNRLRELRKEKKLTQKYLAQKLDVAKLTISR